MLKILKNLFKKKELTEEELLEKELKKYPRKDRERLRQRLKEYNDNKILKIYK